MYSENNTPYLKLILSLFYGHLDIPSSHEVINSLTAPIFLSSYLAQGPVDK
jgi:hypothetical protein